MVSADSFANNLHRVLECLDALRQTVDDLILRIETVIHFILEALSQAHELRHCFLLELFDILVLLLQLRIGAVLEGSQLESLVGSLVVNLLLKVVLAVVDFLHDVFLAFNARLHLTVKLVLKTYITDIVQLTELEKGVDLRFKVSWVWLIYSSVSVTLSSIS